MSEVRLIDANALINKMVNEPVKAVDGVDFDTEWFTRIADTAVQFTDMVKNAPTVDAMPVTRCGQCKHGSKCPLGVVQCKMNGYKHRADWFCADGERR